MQLKQRIKRLAAFQTADKRAAFFGKQPLNA